MQDGITKNTAPVFNSLLSFRPLIEELKRNIAEGNPGLQKLYGHVIKELEAHPELLETISDLSILTQYNELIEELLSAVFPPTTANYMYGISYPFKNLAVYASPLFKKQLIKESTNEIIFRKDSASSLDNEKLHFAYGLILKKYLGFSSAETTREIYPVRDDKTGLTRYMELRLDGRFIDIHPVDEMPKMPASILDQHNNRLLTLPELMHQVPLEKFFFEGLTVIRINDVTEQAVIADMKNKLLDFDAISDAYVFTELENHIQNLIGLKGLTIGLTPFFKINNHYIYSNLHNSNSLLFRYLHSTAEKDEISDYCKLLFRENSQPVLYESLTEEIISEVQCLPNYYKSGSRSIIICPLKQHGELLGLLEISSKEAGCLKPYHISKIEPAIPLFTLGMGKSLDQLNNQVDRVIKKKFTAVQPAVEWKFTEASLSYIVHQAEKKEADSERILFNNVYPLYGAIDVRNSSTARSHSVQLDMLEQLTLALKVVRKAQAAMSFPLLQEIEFKIDRHIIAASDILQSEEEMSVYDFLQGQVISIFNHLRNTEPAVKNEIEEYFASLDPQLGMLYKHRKQYEQNISLINETLARFIDKEQAAAQKVYPHYFEKYITDGLEFNIFIGQSISPRNKFDEIYLRNLKMWQLTVLAKAARITYKLEKNNGLSLRTTQLILAHSQPLSICFRTEERKFDVDGVYNTRYEIVKKRIDKVRIKDTGERLTQPGKIAIVYSQAKDAGEYTEYIEFLQSKNLLKQGIEKYDLEELPGVSGLKALRVDVILKEEPREEKRIELSGITSGQMPGKQPG